MGVNLPKEVTLAGFRLSKVKQALKAYARTGSPENFHEIRSFADSRLDAAVLYEELVERRLINPEATNHEDFLTDAGLALASGKTRRSALANALRVLDEQLARLDAMNADPGTLNYVDKVWLFGSVMRREETVGDIDLAIEMVRNPAFEQDGAVSRRLRELVDLAPRDLPYHRKLYWHEEQAIYGARQHPLLAGANMGLDDLLKMGVPCQLIFDRSRGGRVDDEPLHRHPASNGRSNDMDAPRELPSLDPLPTRPAPMDARWMSAHSAGGRIYPRRLLPDDTRFPNYDDAVLTDGSERRFHNWIPKSFKYGGFDGVSQVLLKYHDQHDDPTGRYAAALTLRRHVVDQPDTVELHYRLSNYERPRRLRPRADTSFIHLSSMVAALLRGDIVRQSIRLAEQNSPRIVTVDMDTEALPEELRARAPIWVQQHMKNFAEPEAFEACEGE